MILSTKERLLSNGIRLASRSLTLYRRRDAHFRNKAEEQRAAESARKFLADSFSWQQDSALISQLLDLLGTGHETDSHNARWKVRHAFETGELIAVPDAPGSGLTGSRGSDMPRPRSVTFTPSQLFKRATSTASSIRSYTAPQPFWDFPAMDGLAIWAAKPGDVLPDGTIAKPNSMPIDENLTFESVRRSMLGDAQPLEYHPELVDGDAFETASQATKTPNTGAPGTWYTNPGSGQMRLYGDSGAPVIDLDFDHMHNGLRPHAHNWNDGMRDGGSDVVPFSPWNP
jgi:hypothetical protein